MTRLFILMISPINQYDEIYFIQSYATQIFDNW